MYNKPLIKKYRQIRQTLKFIFHPTFPAVYVHFGFSAFISHILYSQQIRYVYLQCTCLQLILLVRLQMRKCRIYLGKYSHCGRWKLPKYNSARALIKSCLRNGLYGNEMHTFVSRFNVCAASLFERQNVSILCVVYIHASGKASDILFCRCIVVSMNKCNVGTHYTVYTFFICIPFYCIFL